jgi:heavy metal-binding protein
MNFLRFTTTPLLAAALLFSVAAPYNAPVASTNAEQAAHSKKPASFHYVCPMHPDVTSSKPGECPKCKMQLQKRRIKDPA